MFCFLNLGTCICYTAGAVAMGGGSYTVWHFKDTMSASSVTPSSLNGFNETHKTTKDEQEKISSLETNLNMLNYIQDAHQKNIDSLSMDIDKLNASIQAWKNLINESEEEIKTLTNNKDQLEENFNNKKFAHDAQDKEVIKLQKSLEDDDAAVSLKQTQLAAAVEKKFASEKSVEDHENHKAVLATDIAKSLAYSDQLKSKKSKADSDFDTNEATLDKNTNDTKSKQTEIEEKIDAKIKSLDSSIEVLEGEIQTLVSAISRLTDPTEATEKRQKEAQKSNKTNSKNLQTNQKNKLQKQKSNLESFTATDVSDTSLSDQIKKAIDDIKSLKDQKPALEKIKIDLTSQKNQLQNKITEEEKKHAKLKHERDVLNAENTKNTNKQDDANDYGRIKKEYDDAVDKQTKTKEFVESGEKDLRDKKDEMRGDKILWDKSQKTLLDVISNKTNLKTIKDISDTELMQKQGEKDAQDLLKQQVENTIKQETIKLKTLKGI